jgi:hypothetical protein
LARRTNRLRRGYGAPGGTAVPCDRVIIYRSIVRELPQNEWIMKYYSLLVEIIVAAVSCSSLLAQEKAALQPSATVLSILQGSTGKTVELRLNSGEKIGGKVEQVNDNFVLLPI